MGFSIQISTLARTSLIVICAVVLSTGAAASGEEIRSLVVITSRDDGPYEGVVVGVRGALGGSEGDAIQVRSLQTEREAAMAALREARKAGDAPLITVGSRATRAALQAPGAAPVVACMIVDAEDLAGAKNATGVVLEFPLETQLEWIRRILPGSQAIGVLYNPAENRKRIEEMRKIAKRLGLRVVARKIHRPQDLPGALNSLAREVDILFAITDKMVLSRQTAQAILLFSFRNRLPFSGLSASWVKAGALYSLERDYEDLGAQCAEMAVKVFNGKRASSISPATPRKLVYSLNLRTAEHLKLSLPPELVEGAAEVFR